MNEKGKADIHGRSLSGAAKHESSEAVVWFRCKPQTDSCYTDLALHLLCFLYVLPKYLLRITVGNTTLREWICSSLGCQFLRCLMEILLLVKHQTLGKSISKPLPYQTLM